MATPRKNYFRVGDSILREPWTREQKLTLVLLQAHLNTRWRRDGIPNEKAGHCVLGRGDLQTITGKSWVRVGQNLLKTLESLVTLSVKSLGEFTEVDWPKFPEFQLFTARGEARDEPALDVPRSPLSALHTPPTEESNAPAPPDPPHPRRDKAKPKPPPPADALQVARYLAVKLVERRPHARVPKNLDGWARAIAAVYAPIADTLAAVDWLYSEANEGHFRIVVESGASFASKWNKTNAAMERAQVPHVSPGQERLDRMAADALRSQEQDHERSQKQAREQQRRRTRLEAESTCKPAGLLPSG